MPGSSTDNTDQLQQFRCKAQPNQGVAKHTIASPFFDLRLDHDGKCFDVPNGTTAERARVDQFTSNGGLNHYRASEPSAARSA